MSGYATALVLTALTVGAIVYLLRSRRIREKYAAIWILFAVVVAVIGAFPDVLASIAKALGVIQPVNLLFIVTGLVLFVVCVQFSVEISKLEEETRTLAEELALLAAKVDAQIAGAAPSSTETAQRTAAPADTVDGRPAGTA